MGKKSASKRGEPRGEGASQEARSKSKHELGTVNSRIIPLFRNAECTKAYREKFHSRPILEPRSVNFKELELMFAEQHVDTGNHLAVHGWIEFVKVKRPVYENLLRILFANLDVTTMTSWIGKKKIDLSVAHWCEMFDIPNVSQGAEEFIMNMSGEDLFFRLTGERHLGVMPHIKVNQLHQEPTVRLAAQIVMNVLVPKKGSKEQIKPEEGRLIYALLYGAEINLAQLIVERIRGIVSRISSPICYAMHLVAIMERAGVTLTCAGDEPKASKSEINHHTLKRLGYTFRHGGWDYVGRGRVNAPRTSQSTHRETHEDTFEEVGDHTHEEHTHDESAAPSFPPSSQPQSSNINITSQLAHLRTFVADQFHLLQATLLSKMDILDIRLQACEEHILRSTTHQQPPHPTPTPHDPKGKRPLHSTPPSSPLSHHSPHHSPIPSPQPSHHSTHSNHSHHSSPPPTAASEPQPNSPASSSTQFELVARTPVIASTSPDSEATHSDPTPTTPVLPSPSEPPSASPRSSTISYKRRKKAAVSK